MTLDGQRAVPDVGPRSAKIVVVGEAPGAQEEQQLLPFVGPSGHMLTQWMAQAGIKRRDVYITNVYPFKPPDNDIKRIPGPVLHEWMGRLHDRLAKLDDPVVIVPTGNTALRALVGKTGITKHRGSIYVYEDRRGRHVKIIGTLHPAYILRQMASERAALADWRRIATDSGFAELRLPQRTHHTRPTLDDLVDYVIECENHPGDPIAIDIETPRRIQLVAQPPTKKGTTRRPKRIKGERRITCIAFSRDPSFSITIPTTIEYWRHEATLDVVWGQIRRLCAGRNEKALQNGLFDTYWLAGHGCAIENWRWDTLAMHHALDAADTHSLAYMASIDTRQPFWKDMKDAKDDEDDAGEPPDQQAFWIYNGIDAAVTRELVDVYAVRLDERGLASFYGQHYRAMFQPLLSLMQHGIQLDGGLRAARLSELEAAGKVIRARLEELAGVPLHGKKDLSPKKVAWFLYEKLKIPPRHDRATGHITAKETTIRQLMIKYPDKLGEAGPLILDHRRKKKLSEFLQEGVADADGRVRCHYKFTTSTGRLASAKNPRGTGRNLQNIDRELRDVLLPDTDCILLEVDLSQAESRIVGVLTGDPKLIQVARAAPWELDVHRRNASIIFRKQQAEVTQEERYLGKRAVHASNYGMHGQKLSEELLKDGYEWTPDECEAMIESYLDANPGIRAWQQRTRMMVMADRRLVNSWGRIADFRYERLSDELYRQAYAFVPQSEIADLLNCWGLVPLHCHLTKMRAEAGWRSRINLQVHDSLVISTPPNEAWDVYCFAKRSLERPRVYQGVELIVPVEVKLGRTWKAAVEFKEPPTKTELEEAAWKLVQASS